MSEYLFLTGTYLPMPGANGAIIDIIIKDLKNRGHSITVLSTKNNKFESDFEIINDIKIHRIDSSNYSSNLKKKGVLSKLNLIKRRLTNLFLFWDFPNFDRNQVDKTVKKAIEIISSNDIQHVIAVNKPHSNINASYVLKDKFPEIDFGAYYLDLLTGINKPKLLPKSIYKKLLVKSYKKTFKKLDFILLPESFGQLEDYNLSHELSSKIEFVDYPTFNSELNIGGNYSAHNSDRKNKFSLIFAGTLDLVYRNPKVFLETVSKMDIAKNDIQINIFGKNNCQDIFDDYSSKVNLINNGFQSKEIINKYYEDSNYLVNISNSYSDVVPSKIFELFSMGKPIINFVKNEEDYSLRYFEEYPICFNFYEWKDFASQVSNLKDFMISNLGKTVDNKLLSEIYYKNQPKYTVNAIEKHTVEKDNKFRIIN